MPKIRYAEFYKELEETGQAKYYFSNTQFDDLGRPIEVMQLRSALTRWASHHDLKVATRYNKEEQTLTAHILPVRVR